MTLPEFSTLSYINIYISVLIKIYYLNKNKEMDDLHISNNLALCQKASGFEICISFSFLLD